MEKNGRFLILRFGLLAPFLLLAFVVLGSSVTPDYSQIDHTISRLAAQTQPYPIIMSTGLILFGGMTFLFGMSASKLFSPVHEKLLKAGFAIFGLSILITGVFRDYPPGLHNQPGNIEGYLHNLFAKISIMGLLLAAFTTSHAVYRDSRWHPLGKVTVVLTATMVLLGLLHFLIRDDLLGLKQRVLMSMTCLWLVVYSGKSLSIVKKSKL